jgi:hypothetical protein
LFRAAAGALGAVFEQHLIGVGGEQLLPLLPSPCSSGKASAALA